MATPLPEAMPVPIVDLIAAEINQTINMLIDLLNQRRMYLLSMYRDKRDQMRADGDGRVQMEQQLNDSRLLLENAMTHNQLHSTQKKIVEELENKLEALRANGSLPQELRLLCDTQDLEDNISKLGEIIECEIPPLPEIPDYAAFKKSTHIYQVHSSLDYDWGRGVAVDEKTEQIYVADNNFGRVFIFSNTGDYLKTFGADHLEYAWGIMIHQDNVYVTDWEHNAIFQFTLPDLTMIKRVGKRGSGREEFSSPCPPAVSPSQLIYVPDEDNHRIQILTTNLTFQGSIQHQTMNRPCDLKFSTNQMFVLSYEDNPCVHIFALSGEKIRSILSRGRELQVEVPYFFCVDARSNVVISDWCASEIKVFSTDGELLHSIMNEGMRLGLYKPFGVAILSKTKLVSVTSDGTRALQIFTS